MSVHLEREISRLKKRLLSLCAVVEDQVQMAVRSLLQRDVEMAQGVESRDRDIDQQEVEVEEDCLKILALHQPVAIDLRVVVSALKINNDLERIGDLAVNIAHKAVSLAEGPYMDIPFDLEGMWQKTQSMLQDALDAMVNLDATQAANVCSRDDEVDRMKHDIRLEVEAMIARDPSQTTPLLRLAAASRNLERIADLATNIAEDVIYMIEGRIVRHAESD
jgi:phosphate transport system protein